MPPPAPFPLIEAAVEEDEEEGGAKTAPGVAAEFPPPLPRLLDAKLRRVEDARKGPPTGLNIFLFPPFFLRLSPSFCLGFVVDEKGFFCFCVCVMRCICV